jgi:hypothetical protein
MPLSKNQVLPPASEKINKIIIITPSRNKTLSLGWSWNKYPAERSCTFKLTKFTRCCISVDSVAQALDINGLSWRGGSAVCHITRAVSQLCVTSEDAGLITSRVCVGNYAVCEMPAVGMRGMVSSWVVRPARLQYRSWDDGIGLAG